MGATTRPEDLAMVPLGDLVPDPVNARKHGEKNLEEVKRSLREFGQHAPLVVQRSTGRILVGNCRYEAMKALEWNEGLVLYVDDDNVTAVRRALADNRTAELAEWDDDILRELLESTGGLDADVPGFDLADLEELLGESEAEGTEGLIDPDEVPEEVEPVTELGDLWILGKHRLLCGDSTNPEAVACLMDGAKADMLLTDPPYNVAYEGKTKEKLAIKNDAMADDKFFEFLFAAFLRANEAMKPGAVFYVWHADSEGLNFRRACKEAGLTVRQCLIWNKNSLVLGRQDYQWKHEPCLYGWKEGAGHLWASDRKQTTVLDFERPSRSADHPTMKPVALFEYQMLNNTKGQDVVLDLFGGSGTTIIACEKNGRRGFCMELDPRYCDVIVKRWENFTGKKAERLNGTLGPSRSGAA